jgi:hypothetical protein
MNVQKETEIALRTSKMYVHSQALPANPCYTAEISCSR